MEILFTIGTVMVAIFMIAAIVLVAGHPTAGKIQNQYHDKYKEQYRRNLPPF